MCRQAPTTNTSFISVSNLHKSLETIPVSHCLAPNSVTKGKVLKAKKKIPTNIKYILNSKKESKLYGGGGDDNQCCFLLADIELKQNKTKISQISKVQKVNSCFFFHSKFSF